MKGQASPAFHRTRSVPAAFEPSMSLKDLWRAHSKAMRSKPVDDLVGPSLLDLKLAIAKMTLSSCHLCEKRCGTDRTAGRPGRCGVLEARIASHFLHHGEEAPLVPSYTIFFAGCNLECVFCQNCDISTDPRSGKHIPSDLMARRLENLSEVGRAGFKVTLVREWAEKARNVNWVGGEPTPNLAYVLEVLRETRTNLPQIWNSNMYMSEEAMRLLSGAIDVYLADLKYGNDECARRYSQVDDYFRIATRNHALAAKGADLLVRHLMLPGHLECCTYPVLDWLAENVPGAAVNIMDQYRPMNLAHEHPELMARVGPAEHQAALRRAQGLGLSLL
ncbi:MAG: radical SAM protein [Methanomassiliicoccales archaeon]|nr:radical SAM protein [Methanomassiliicoccales archaeon]